MAKKKKEISDMSKDQLVDHIEVLKKELFNLKIEIMSGQNNNTSNISKSYSSLTAPLTHSAAAEISLPMPSNVLHPINNVNPIKIIP